MMGGIDLQAAGDRVIKGLISCNKCLLCMYLAIFMWIGTSFSSVDAKGKPACGIDIKNWILVFTGFNILINLINIASLSKFKTVIIRPANGEQMTAFYFKKFVLISFFIWIINGMISWFSKDNNCGYSKVAGTGFLNSLMFFFILTSLWCPH